MVRDWFSRNIAFKLGAGPPLFIVAVVLSVLFVVVPGWREELIYITLVVGGAAALYSAFYAGAAAREQSERQRMSNTFAMIRSVDEPELLKLRDVLDVAIDHRKDSPTEILTTINATSELRTAVRGLLNTYEDIAVAIRMGYADEPLVYACMGTMMRTSVDKYSSYIQDKQKGVGRNRAFRELELVAASWTSGRYHTQDRAIPDDPCQ